MDQNIKNDENKEKMEIKEVREPFIPLFILPLFAFGEGIPIIGHMITKMKNLTFASTLLCLCICLMSCCMSILPSIFSKKGGPQYCYNQYTGQYYYC